MKRAWIVGCASALLGAAPFVEAPRAAACGGFFCSNVPVDQSGENILWAVEADGTMTTIVQILYQGAAERFAWILPVPSEPEISVGTDALFTQLGARTAPSFELEYRTEGACRTPPSCARFPGEDNGFRGGSGSFADASAGQPEPATDDRVDVLSREAVGPYDAAVLRATDAAVLRTWLTDNEYDIPEAAGKLLDDYVASGHLFVALKLLKDRASGEIQPVVLRHREENPCLPIKLTSISTVPDLPITGYVLGASFARPMNYASVEPDLETPGLWSDWDRSLYRAHVSSAIDDVGGQGFVTEFAGDTPVLSLALTSVADLREQTDAEAFMSALVMRGFAGDSQLFALLARHLVPPPPYEGDGARSYYNCLGNGWGGCGEPESFDPAALADAIEETIVAPRREADELLRRHARTTRLFTTMSAPEMTVDPLFELSPALAPVSNRHVAVETTHCNGLYFDWTAPRSRRYPSGRVEQTSEGVPYWGTDAAFCEDMRSGAFAPWTPPTQLAETARYRRMNPEASNEGCSVGPRSEAGAAIGLAFLAFVFGRRPRRPRPTRRTDRR